MLWNKVKVYFKYFCYVKILKFGALFLSLDRGLNFRRRPCPRGSAPQQIDGRAERRLGTPPTPRRPVPSWGAAGHADHAQAPPPGHPEQHNADRRMPRLKSSGAHGSGAAVGRPKPATYASSTVGGSAARTAAHHSPPPPPPTEPPPAAAHKYSH